MQAVISTSCSSLEVVLADATAAALAASSSTASALLLFTLIATGALYLLVGG
jgi:hypothetical protein